MYRLLPIFLFAIVLAGCQDPNAVERQLLISELQEVERRHALASQQISERRSATHRSETRLKALRSELADYEGRVQAFMMNHKMAIAALTAGTGGTAVALDPTNEFSDEARQVGGIVGAIGAFYCLSNFEECSHVGDQLTQASAQVDQYNSLISSAETDFNRDRQLLATVEEELQALTEEGRSLRMQLRAMQE